MTHTTLVRNHLLQAAALAAVAFIPALASAQVQGPSSSKTPYLLGSNPNIQTLSIMTVGDTVGGYTLAGILDGLGAYDNGNGTFTVLANHELGSTVGSVRAHGSKGAFVSEWVIRKSDFTVLSGNDLITGVNTWNASTSSYNPTGTTAYSRLCSADLPSVSAFYNSATGLGTQTRIFMHGEETGAEGRAFATIATGASKGLSYELPHLGKLSFENSVANPFAQDKTIVIGTDDTTPGQVYVYVGQKQASGSEVQKAGLVGGSLYGVKVGVNGGDEQRATGYDGVALNKDSVGFSLHNFGNVSSMTGAQLQTASNANAVSQFLRPEDGAWDPNNAKDFYFVTTDRYSSVKDGTGTQDGRSRLWRMSFSDIANPENGGQLDMLLEGSTNAGQMFDNMTVTKDGKVLLQEDPGNNAAIAKVWSYDISSQALTEIAKHDTQFFTTGGANFLTTDEESSGVIDITDIMQPTDGSKYYLMDVQAHHPLAAPMVEGGQIVVLHEIPEPATYAAIAGAAALGVAVLRRRFKR